MAKSPSPSAALVNRLTRLEREIATVRTQILQREPTLMSPCQPLWVVIKDRLQRFGGAQDLESLVVGLLQEGHFLGKYPRRSVKQAVRSPHVRAFFTAEKSLDRKAGKEIETIKLTHASANYIPPKLRSTYAARMEDNGAR